ncbi:hypothetical protein ABFV58_17845, partial [Pseudomonas protegens]
MNDQAIHHAAADGYQQAADTYVRGRPDYPPALEPWLRETLGLGLGRRQPGAHLLDRLHRDH